MGSWSVYCGISNISITSGNSCVLLPLKKNDHKGREDYLPYLPATLPIFGSYNDYGGIEEIEQDANTALIESHFGVTIDEFCEFLLDGRHTYDREEAKETEAKIQNLEEAKDWQFMWIDRQVYDFLSTHAHDGYHGKGNHYFGKEWLLKLMGFKYIGENEKNPTYDPKRYKYEWRYGRKKFFSDGSWLYCGKSGSIYNWRGEYSSLHNYVTMPEELQWIGERAPWQMWEYMPKSEQFENLGWIIGMDRYHTMISRELMEEINAKIENREPRKVFSDTLVDKYLADFKTYGSLFCGLVSVRHNIYAMSGRFDPYTLYITPQCGEYGQHQIILDKFAEINRSYIHGDEDDE